MRSSIPSPSGGVCETPGIGLVIPTFPQTRGVPCTAELTALCRAAEEAGAAGLWACDHLFWHGPALECLSTLSLLAAISHRALLGSCVLQLPLRHPAAVAKTATTLQHLSGGRFVLGVGVGVHAGEYDAAGVSFADRGRRLDDAVCEIRRHWEMAHAEEVYYRQLPTAPLPIWVGGASQAARERAAANDGWIPLFISPGDYRDGLSAIRERAERSDRDPQAIIPAVVVFVSVGEALDGNGGRWLSSLYDLPPRAFARHLIEGSPRRVVGELARWVEAGARHVAVFVCDDRPTDAFVELAHTFADVVGAVPEVGGKALGGARI